MASSAETESLRNRLSNKEEEVRELTSELSQLEEQLRLRVREDERERIHPSLSVEVELASASTRHDFLMVWLNQYYFPVLEMNDR